MNSFRKVDLDLFDLDTDFLNFFLQIRLNCFDFKASFLDFFLQAQFGFAQITLGRYFFKIGITLL